MIQKSIQIKLETGLEARPVAMLVQVASQFESTVYLGSDNKKVNAKSIMGMMTLGMDLSEDLEISAEGADEEMALDGITDFLTGEE